MRGYPGPHSSDQLGIQSKTLCWGWVWIRWVYIQIAMSWGGLFKHFLLSNPAAPGPHICTCIGYCSSSLWQISDKSSLRKERFVLTYSLRVWSIMVGKAWHQQHEASVHIGPAGREQRGELWFSAHLLFSQGPLPMVWCDPHLRWVFWCQPNLKLLIDIPEVYLVNESRSCYEDNIKHHNR